MKNLILCIFCFLIGIHGLNPLPLEANLNAGYARRFIDTFDRRWNGIQKDNSSFTDEEIKDRGYLRLFLKGDAEFFVSPFYKHFLGISGQIDYAISEARLLRKTTSDTTDYSMGLLLWSIHLDYKFYPLLEQKNAFRNLYFHAKAGYLQGASTLQINSNGGSSGSYTFDRLRGIKLAGRAGILLPISNVFFLNLFAGFETAFISSLDGTNSSGETVTLKASGSAMAPVPFSQESLYDGFKKIPLWVSEFVVGAGITLRLNNT